MKTLLTIGSSHFVLPASVNVNALMAVFQKAQPVRQEFNGSKGYIYYPLIGDSERYRSEVKIEMIPDEYVIDTKKLKSIAENASPDAHNTF